MKTKSMKIYRIVLCSLIFLTIILGFTYIYKSYYDRLPKSIILQAKKEQTISYDLPISGTIYHQDDKSSDEEESLAVISEVHLGQEITMVASKPENYILKTKLFGLIPLKEVNISVVDEVKLIPVGVPVGIYAKTDGLLVVDTGEFKDSQGKMCEPTKDCIYAGDYILQVDGKFLENKYDLVTYINDSEGKTLEFLIDRNGKQIVEKVTPQKNESGDYKIGIWIKDNAQGIGTLTYVTQTGEFGALGHGIIDLEIENILKVSGGNLYRAEILGIRKGKKGVPGEMTGVIFYGQNKLGEISSNYETGIYGNYDLSQTNYFYKGMQEEAYIDGVEIAYKNEINTGKAEILCTIDGKTKCYEIVIEKIYLDAENINKSMKITVTDEELLAKTGGIVQGMSGSPILQNGKIVGAVTHVLVNDPTRGYGIFIEDMVGHN